MRDVSDTLLAAVRGSHGGSARVKVLTTYQEGTSPTGTEIVVLDGDVDQDASADVRSTLEMTTEQANWPTSSSGLLVPFGNELYVESGVRLGNGTTEWVSLGYFRIDSIEQDDAPKGPVRISAKDRMAGIVDGRLTEPRTYTTADTYGDVVTELVTDIYPDVTIVWDDSTDDRELGRSVLTEDDRYAFLDDLIKSVGKVWYWDYRGRLTIKDPPDPATPVYDVTSGADGVLITLGQDLSRETTYNGVVATGEAADTTSPVRAVVVDTGTRSPTRWGGRFGKVPRFYSSPLLTTAAQAQSAAASLLRTSIGLPYNMDFSLVPNPGLEPLDPVRVSTPVGDRVHVLDRLTVPLVADREMTGKTREQTLVIIGGLT